MQQSQNTEVPGPPLDNALLFDRFGQAVFAYIKLHITSREDAEDLTTEVFIVALEHGNLAHIPESEQLAWLRRVAYHKIVDSYRRLQRHPHIALAPDHADSLSMAHDTPEQLLLRNEAYMQLQQAIATLPVLQQQALRLRYGDGLRCTEIAVLLNKREDAVRKLLSRTLTTLRRIYPLEERS